jgi:dTDP-L-rhamnose 4-epimerase
VAAIFSARLLNGNPPLVFEDGEQLRDFVHVSDIAQANLLAMETDRADFQALNIGSGAPVTVNQVAHALAAGLGRPIAPTVTQKFRVGDIRHCFADGVPQLLAWVRDQQADDRVEQAAAELAARRLTV